MTEHQFKITINGQEFDVKLPELTGAQVRALIALDPAHEIVVEGRGAEADAVISDDDKVSLAQGPRHAFTRPQTSFGIERG